ncbi:hypothetical protein PAAG_07483 [Paracoccidioides lutzii Pb01]|uniref:DUF1279 domain-containing protein n=1 Tax=Paracoccidioides lutzii (strain ATCC MYA-826 / Pb01) TaxID=502779 RepID=C1H9P2_PARBA|nr:hypothetical protein PAAG_07483 [Paracoccidioides lutzii Pb01]EEH37065.1 hypothetical protein PAAG_07483 [Paracoccidioides lutzii Pb01]
MPPPSRFLPRGAIRRLARPFSAVQSLPVRATGFHPCSLSTTKPPQTQSFHQCATNFRPRINATPLRSNGIHPILQWRKPRCLNSSSSSSSSSEKLSFSQRMKKLSREYGWSALGVYLALSALDFPFCFAAVRLLGAERIGHYEHVVAEGFKGVFAPIWQTVAKPDASGGSDSDAADGGKWGDMAIAMGGAGGAGGTGEWDGHARAAEAEGQNVGTGTGTETETEAGASLWTQLALAYAVHKSLIFIRVPITAAVTPKVVKVLRQWGWDIGKRRPKSS